MPREFKLPDLGEGLAEASIVEWKVKEGDELREGDVMVVVETDKATVDIPAPFGGRVTKVHFAPGQVAKVGEVLLEVAGEGEPAAPVSALAQVAAPAAASTARTASPAPPPSEGEQGAGAKVPATPVARRVARELGVDIATVRGTGPGGRVTREDVERVSAGTAPTAAAPTAAPAAPPPAAPAAAPTGPVETIPFVGIRRRIAEHLTLSVREIPHVTHFDEADVTDLMAHLTGLKEEAAKRNLRLTPTPFFVKAVCAALREFPLVNSQLDLEQGVIKVLRYYHIGVAVASERGLFVPVVKNADQKSIFAIAREVVELANKVRDGSITRDELMGGTFTITNVGGIGGLASTPIINHPQVAILGVHKIIDKPVVQNGNIVVRKRVMLALSYDHRVIDGADSARFTNAIIGYLANPMLLLAEG